MPFGITTKRVKCGAVHAAEYLYPLFYCETGRSTYTSHIEADGIGNKKLTKFWFLSPRIDYSKWTRQGKRFVVQGYIAPWAVLLGTCCLRFGAGYNSCFVHLLPPKRLASRKVIVIILRPLAERTLLELPLKTPVLVALVKKASVFRRKIRCNLFESTSIPMCESNIPMRSCQRCLPILQTRVVG